MTADSAQFTCTRCGTVYGVDAEQIGEAGRRARCAVCGHLFVVRLSTEPAPLTTEATAPEAPEEIPAPAGEAIDIGEGGDDIFFVEKLEEAPDAGGGPEGAEAVEPELPADLEAPAEGDTLIRPTPSFPPEEAAPATAEAPDPPADVEMPEAAGELLPESLATRRRWRDPMQAERRGRAPIFVADEGAREPSGILYKLIILAVGVAALATSFFELRPWQVDPVYATTLIALGLLSFGLQCMSGILIAGLFGFFYPLAVFSRQVPAVVDGALSGLALIGALTAFAVVLLLAYALLIARKRALFVIKEGSGQSLVAFLLGLLTLAVVVWAHLESPSIFSLADIAPAGRPLGSIDFYEGVGVPVLLQACVLSLAIAFGFSARSVRNRVLTLANLGVALGFLALLFLYVPLVVGPVRLSLPW